MKKNVIKEKSYTFALDTLILIREFPKNVESYILTKQLIRCSTSIGANIEEALTAFTKNDFIYKMNLSLKECKESNYWLRLIRDSKLNNSFKIDDLINKSEEIRKILTSIIKTSQEKK